MRKKATIWGVALSLALGASAFTASSLLPAFFGVTVVAEEGDETEEPEEPAGVDPVRLSPANGATISQQGGLVRFTVDFDGQRTSLMRDADNIIVKKGEETIQVISPATPGQIVPGSGSTDYVINLESAIVNDGTYTIEVPAGLFLVVPNLDPEAGGDTPEEGEEEPAPAIAQPVPSNAFTVTYTVVRPIVTSCSPAYGSALTELTEFVVTFSEASAITLTDDYDIQDQCQLFFKKGSTATMMSNTILSVDGNKLTIKLTDPYKTPSSAAITSEYEYITLPEGLLTLTIDGVKQTNKQMNIGNWQVLAVSPSMIESSIFGNVAGTPAADIAEFTIKFDYEDDVQYVGTNYSYFYMRPYGNASTNYASFGVAAVTGEKNTFKFTMKAPGTGASILNNPSVWESGEYWLCFPANVFQRTIDGTAYKNIAMNFGHINLKGVSTNVPTLVAPADNTVISATDGLKQIALTFNLTSEVVNGKTVNIYRGEETTPVFSFPANGNYLTVASAKVFTYNFPAITTPGDYRVVFPEGTFRQTSGNGLLSGEMTYNYSIPVPLAHSVAPASMTSVTSGTDLETITYTYPEGSVITLKDPEAVIGMWKTSISGNPTYTYTATVEGNKVILKKSNTTAWGAAGATQYILPIAGGLWTIKSGDVTTINQPTNLCYKIDQCVSAKISWSAETPVTLAELLQGFTIYAPEGQKVYKVNNNANYSPKLFGNDKNGLAPSTSATNTFAQFFGTINADSTAVVYKPILPDFEGTVNYATRYNTYATPTGSYLLRVYNSTTETSASFDICPVAALVDPSTGKLVTSSERTVAKSMWDYVFNVEGVTTSEITSDLKANYEVAPTSMTISSDAALSFFEGFDAKFWVRKQNGATWANGKQVNGTFADGKYTIDLTGYGVYTDGTYILTTGNTATALTQVGIGTFKIAGEGESYSTNPNTNFLFNVTGEITNPTKIISPAPGAVKIAENPRGIEFITLTYDAGMKIAIDYSNTLAHIYVFRAGDTTPVQTLNAYSLEIDGETVYINLDEALTEGGDYTIIIDPGMLLFGELKGKNTEISFQYQIQGLDPATVASYDPADQTLISQFTGVTVNFTTPAEIASVETTGLISLNYYNPLDPMGETTTLPLYAYLNPDKTSIILTIDESTEAVLTEQGRWPYVETGTYTINITPNAYVVKDAEGNVYGAPEAVVEYDVIATTPAQIAPDNGKYITSLDQFTISFPEYAEVKVANSIAGIKAEVYTFDADNNKVVIANTAALENGKVVVSFDAQTALDTYFVVLPAKSLALVKKTGDVPVYNSKITGSYTITPPPSLSSVYPADNSILTEFCNVNLIYTKAVTANRACTENATVTLDGNVIYTLGNRSANCQLGVQNPNEAILNFAASKSIKTPGTYVVNIPAEFLLLGGVAKSEAMTYTYTILPPINPVFAPRQESVLEEFEFVTMTFPGAKEVVEKKVPQDDDDSDTIFACISTASGYSSNPEVTIEGDVVIMKFAKSTAEGKYSLQIPAGWFEYTNEQGVTMKNERILIAYYITGIGTPILNPAPGFVTAEQMQQNFTLSLADDMVFSKMVHGTSYGLYPADQNGLPKEGETYVNVYMFDYQKDGSADGKKTINLYNTNPGLVLTPGNYVLRVNRLLVQTDPYSIDPEENPDQTITMKVIEATYNFVYTVIDGTIPEVAPVVTPEAGDVKDLDVISIAYPGFDGVSVNNQGAVLNNAEEGQIMLEAEAALNVVTLTPAEKVETGTWTLNIPEGTFSIDYKGIVAPAPALNVTYVNVKESNGLAALFADGELLNVYTVDGICVLRDATAEEAARLDAGLYVINGKTVYLRK